MKKNEIMLKLKRPIVFFDLECTGLDTQEDRIVEISMLKLYPDGKEEIKSRRINPGIPIPAQSTEIHGITDEDVKDCPTFFSLSKSIHEFISDSDIAGFNSNFFDVPFLYNEFLRCGIEWDYTKHNFIDVGNIFKILNPRTLEAAVKHYLKREHDGAHGAEADTIATKEVLLTMLAQNDEIPQDTQKLALYSNYDKPILDLSGKFTFDDEGNIIFNFGKYRGEKATDHIDYVEWIYSKDFPPDVKDVCRRIFEIDGSLY